MHVSVLAEEALAWLAIKPDGYYVDCTAGAGGHSAAIVEHLGPRGRLLAIDRDEAAVAKVQQRLQQFEQAQVVWGNYGDLKEILAGVGWPSVDGVLIDAGLSSVQLDNPERGFSFQAEGPLDMRMDPSQGMTAAAWLASTPEKDMAQALRNFADVRKPGRVAATLSAIARSEGISDTSELRDAVATIFGKGEHGRSEARRVFQAVRIAVNDELRALDSCVRAAIDVLNTGGRVVAISFHSGEDRVVKNVFRDESKSHHVLHPDGRVKDKTKPRVRALTPKPIKPSADEIRQNRRAQSALLRAAEKLQEL